MLAIVLYIGTMLFLLIAVWKYGRREHASEQQTRRSEWDVYPDTVRRFVNCFTLWGVVALVITPLLLVRWGSSPVVVPILGIQVFPSIKIASLIGWAVFPPAWFVLEHFVLHREHALPGSWEYYVYGRRQAAALWVVGLTLTTAFSKGWMQ
jgi:hypothetical protein